MITDMNQGPRAVSAKPLVIVAEARGFEPRMGANPNRISSPFAAAKATLSLQCPPQSAQVSGAMPGKATEAVADRRNASWAINGPSQTPYSPAVACARTHPAALGHPSAQPEGQPGTTISHTARAVAAITQAADSTGGLGLSGHHLPQDMDRLLAAGTELLGHMRVAGRGVVELAGPLVWCKRGWPGNVGSVPPAGDDDACCL